jgi:hypothetical protein
MAQSEQSTKIIKVVVIVVALGIIFYLFQQVYPAIERRTEFIKLAETELSRLPRNPQPDVALAFQKDSLRNDYVKLVGGSIAVIIAAFFVLHYLTSGKRIE